MTARRTKKNQKQTTAAVKHATPPTEHERHEGREEIWASFWMSIFIAVALCSLNLAVKQTEFGGAVEEMAYGMLQQHLPSAGSPKDPLVLDISDIPRRSGHSLAPSPEQITDREPLKFIVHALAQLNPSPAAIGVDVDFSPREYGYADVADQDVLQTFLQDNDNKTRRIRVGVNESLALGPSRWLNDPNYMDLASCVIVPNPEDEAKSYWFMPEWVEVKYSKLQPLDETVSHCPAMGVALVAKPVANVPPWLRWLVETAHTDIGESLTIPSFLVDYSGLERFEEQAIPVPAFQSQDQANKFALALNSSINLGGRTLLLGRIRNAQPPDAFTIPGRNGKQYPGVLLHACAAYTVQNAPLYQFTFSGDLLMDFLLAGLVFGPMLIIRLHRLDRGKEDFMDFGMPEVLSFLVTAILVVFAIYGVRRTRLMWDDFILVAVALVIHTPAEHAVDKVGSWLKPLARPLLRALPLVSRPRAESKE